MLRAHVRTIQAHLESAWLFRMPAHLGGATPNIKPFSVTLPTKFAHSLSPKCEWTYLFRLS